jgi:hypothetical protein
MEIEIKEIAVRPEFDMWQYCEISQETRIDHGLLEELEPRWKEWLSHLKAYTLENRAGEGRFVLVFLGAEVEDVIDAAWGDAPSIGMALHNLAICMVMNSLQGLMPELADNRCAPIPRPGRGVIEAFARLGLTWREEGSLDRKYAVFTPYPYAGGCEICCICETCPKRKLSD